MYKIQLIAREDFDSIIPLLKLLNPETVQEVIVQRLEEIRKSDYQCVGVYDEERLIAISGIWVLNKIYAGKHIEPDNVIVHPHYSSKGVGELLMNWIHDYAFSIGCITSELNVRVSNEQGRKFWEKMGYRVVGYHFIKPLGDHSDKPSAFNSCLQD